MRRWSRKERQGGPLTLVNHELAVEVLLDDSGKLGPALDAAKGRALPHAAGDQLEGPGGDLGAGGGDTDDDAGAPAPVAGLEGGPHEVDVANTLEGVVKAALGEVDEDLLDGLLVLLRVDKVGGAELHGDVLLVVVDVDGDDAAGPALLGALNHGETDTSHAKDGDGGARLDLGGVDSGAVTGGDAAAEEADLGKRGLVGDLDNGDVSHDGVLGEGGTTHEVEDGLSPAGEAGGAVGHEPLALGGADDGTQVRLGAAAVLALLALGRVQRDHVISYRHAGNP